MIPRVIMLVNNFLSFFDKNISNDDKMGGKRNNERAFLPVREGRPLGC
jgi:hypothetical protein